MNNALFGYSDRDTPIHKINAVAKLVYFLATLIVIMLTYDTRLLLLLTVVSFIALRVSRIQWHEISFFIKLIAFFSLLNLIFIYLFEPEFGVELYNSRTVIWEGIGRYTLTLEQIFYELNVALKYIAMVPLVLVFMLTTNPSEFASSLNRIGISYNISYSVSLTLRYIPDVQRDYFNIRNAQLARGTGKGDATLMDKVKQNVQIVIPLLLTSFEKIDTISQAMTLRRFGTKDKRTWYVQRKLETTDYLVIFVGLIWFILFIVLWQINNGRFYNPF